MCNVHSMSNEAIIIHTVSVDVCVNVYVNDSINITYTDLQ